tara:strand:- start:271 stop:798 length:528 start_codon:yes stop_codon:yes gene_type:complete
MSKIKSIFLVFILLLFSQSFSFAENKIAYIDLDLILSKSIPSQSLFDQLKKIEKTELNILQKKEKEFKDKENKILSTKNIISIEEYNKNVIVFKNELENYQKSKNKIMIGLKNKRNQEVLRFLKQINPLIEKIMEKNSIEILIEKKNIFIAKSNYDITKEIIDIININIKEFIVE